MKLKKNFFPLLLVIFLGYIGFSMTLPLFPSMFLDPTYPLLPHNYSNATRTLLLGILIALFPLGQFIGSPILGKYSDQYGRKKVLIVSLICITPLYLLSYLSIEIQSVSLLFFSRLTSGIFEGNITIAQAAMADASESEEEKVRNFSWITGITSISFVVGPLLSGWLADESKSRQFNYGLPFLGAAALGFLSIFFVYFQFRETLQLKKKYEKNTDTFKQIVRGFFHPKLVYSYVLNFFMFLGCLLFFNFILLYMVKQFDFSVSLLGEANAYLSLPTAIATLFIGKLRKRIPFFKLLTWSNFLIAVSLVLLVLPSSPYSLLFTLLPCGFFIAISLTLSSILISKKASRDEQGHALGINQSLFVLSETITGVFGGILAIWGAALPFYLGAVCCLISAFLLMLTRYPSFKHEYKWDEH